jgi:uncharacterized protein (DUF433 family)
MASSQTDIPAPGQNYPHIEKPEGQPARLRKTPRVRVAQLVMDYLDYGWTAEEMCRQYPYLSPAEAHAAMTYYYDHQEEINREIEDESKQAEEDRRKASPSPFLLRLRAQGLR